MGRLLMQDNSEIIRLWRFTQYIPPCYKMKRYKCTNSPWWGGGVAPWGQQYRRSFVWAQEGTQVQVSMTALRGCSPLSSM